MNKNDNIKFINYLNFIAQTLNVNISIKDTSGFMSLLDSELSMSLIPFLLHTNPYCTYIKSNKSLLHLCSSMSIPINKKCTSLNRTFFGMCHAGVGEYIVPIESKIHGILGFFTVGSYRLDNSKSRELIEKICLDYSLDYNTATELYLSLREVNYDCTLIENAFDIAADYLSKIFDTSKSTNAVSKLSKPVSSEDITMTKILNVLEQNYLENLNVSVISNLCCCSESYISHIFKKKTGVTIKTYINWLRVEKAKHLLKTTDKTITEISNLIGFNNSTYFTKVFTSFEKISPREYKKVAVT